MESFEVPKLPSWRTIAFVFARETLTFFSSFFLGVGIAPETVSSSSSSEIGVAPGCCDFLNKLLKNPFFPLDEEFVFVFDFFDLLCWTFGIPFMQTCLR